MTTTTARFQIGDTVEALLLLFQSNAKMPYRCKVEGYTIDATTDTLTYNLIREGTLEVIYNVPDSDVSETKPTTDAMEAMKNPVKPAMYPSQFQIGDVVSAASGSPDGEFTVVGIHFTDVGNTTYDLKPTAGGDVIPSVPDDAVIAG